MNLDMRLNTKYLAAFSLSMLFMLCMYIWAQREAKKDVVAELDDNSSAYWDYQDALLPGEYPVYDESTDPGISYSFSDIGSIPAPDGFVRVTCTSDSFGAYLRSLLLMPYGTPVLLYDGTRKPYQGGAFAVVDMEIGHSDLQQCADAVIRLRAEYLWQQKRYSEIHFNFTSGFEARYDRWARGERIRVLGNMCSWYNATGEDWSYKCFRKYLDKVFQYAGTASLERELKHSSITDVMPGDVFILGGHPGHAMIVVDVAKDNSGRKAIMVAQSYMPAQDIHIVRNLGDINHNPWYIIDDTTDGISFPEWSFSSDQLKRF